MDRKRNDIGGQWISGENEIENRNPSDLADVVGLHAKEFYTTVKTSYIATGSPE